MGVGLAVGSPLGLGEVPFGFVGVVVLGEVVVGDGLVPGLGEVGLVPGVVVWPGAVVVGEVGLVCVGVVPVAGGVVCVIPGVV